MLLPSQDNSRCFDCGHSHPSWVSVNNGIFLCLNCAGIHRGFGVQISFVRSLLMDKLSSKQMSLLRNGGNKKLYEFFKKYDLIYEPIQKRYHTRAAQFYRERLEQFNEGLREELQLDDCPYSFDVGRLSMYVKSQKQLEHPQNNSSMMISLNNEEILFKGQIKMLSSNSSSAQQSQLITPKFDQDN